ncbi:hypothetical protein [Paenibacillus sp. OV219]|uniref:hypothetical protein n=1 Tax=Paenibacillus sp. OV219 TaxID=1884377 RepID=UPI0008AE6498|nr:hypothetical protein [Paenibacillus sp. OV219]SEP03485.1 hypothetical protein SAMN05518847_114137 [Paenibacillus sp. OV219]
MMNKARAALLVTAALLLLISGTGCRRGSSVVQTQTAVAMDAMPSDMHHQHDSEMGMDMVEPADKGPNRTDFAKWTWPSGMPQAGKPALLRIAVTDTSGEPDQKLQINHEKKLHLIIVSKRLSSFMHLHPVETKAAGVFEVVVNFQTSGAYKLVADFKPADGSQQSQSSWVVVARGKGSEPKSEPVLTADKELTRAAGGMEVSLSFNQEPRAGVTGMLTFSFRDQMSGKPVTDLQPYLGAVGHVVIMDADAEHYVHVHAMDERGKGPNADFHATFPEPGLYKIWGQFKRHGQLLIVPFAIEVK